MDYHWGKCRFISVNAKTKEKKLQQIAPNINLSNLIDCLFTFQIKIVSWKYRFGCVGGITIIICEVPETGNRPGRLKRDVLLRLGVWNPPFLLSPISELAQLSITELIWRLLEHKPIVIQLLLCQSALDLYQR